MYPGAHAATNPDHPAVVMVGSGRTITYGELETRSAALASALHGLGLTRGDVVALLCDNAAEAFEVYWACMRSGLYITPVNRNLTVDEIAYIVADSDAKVLISSAALEAAAQVRAASGQVEHAFAFGGDVAGYFELFTLRRNSDQARTIAQSHQHVLQLATSVATADSSGRRAWSTVTWLSPGTRKKLGGSGAPGLRNRLSNSS